MLRHLLKQVLNEEGKSRYYLWKELGINQGLLSSFFKGEKDISLKNFERIVDKLEREILLVRKSEIGRGRHQEKLTEVAKIAEIEINRIIRKFESSCDVYVRDITLGIDNVKMSYERGTGGVVPTKGRNEPDWKQKSEKPH